MPYQGYFFDFDHTIFDSDASEAMAFTEAMESSGLATRGDAAAVDQLFATYALINRQLWNEVEAGQRNPNEVRELRFVRLVDELGLDVDPTAIAAAFTAGMQEYGELYPDALEVLAALRERGPVALVTNAISQIQRRRIERVGLAAHLDAVVISSEIGVAKPAPAIFEHTFALLPQLDPATTLMVGDSLTSDMAGGFAAGLATCWYNPAGKTDDAAAPVDHEVQRLDQLLDL